MDFLKKLQNLNLFWRKLILWLIMIALGIGLGFLAIKNFQKNSKKFNEEKFFEKLEFLETPIPSPTFISTSTPTSTNQK